MIRFRAFALLAALPFLPLGAAVAAAPVPRPAYYLQVPERVAAGVHVLRQAEPTFTGPIGNVTVIEQSDGIVLIDSGASFGSGQRVVEQVRRLSRKPVKAVVITHWHGDHPLGLAAILASWPNAEVIAHEATVTALQAGRTRVPRAPSASYEAERRRTLTREYAALAAGEVARATTVEERAGWARALATRDLRLADVSGTYLVIPRRTFADRLLLPDRTAPIELLFLGRANTSGDISAWLPRQRVLVAGDAVVEPVPYMYYVYPSEMLAVFDRMRALNYRVLVPGHGTPQRDHAYLDRLSALVREVQRQVAPLARDNVALGQIAGRTDFAAQRTIFAGRDPWLRYWFDLYGLNPLVESVYHETRGEPLGPPPVRTP
jgi:glyoxylase-like metal-dependent hydrolase (beta-lactamase superfamily II)